MTPAIEAVRERIPDHARDLRINLGAIAGSTALTPAQAWTIALACAAVTRDRTLATAIEADAAAAGIEPARITAARAAAAIMGMTNVYYRFVHFMGAESDYAKLPARLRMQVIGNPGIDKLDFELACLAASAIGGCEACVRSHERVVRDRGGTSEMVQDAVRIAAVVNGVAVALA